MGVQLSAARVQEGAEGHRQKARSELTNLDKTMARIKIIFQDTGRRRATARTRHLAQQTKILTANMDDSDTARRS
jgi:hypothetical protein